MHDIVMNGLEKHFTGDAPQAFYEHLEGCDRCREEVADMDRLCVALRELRPDAGAEFGAVPEPSLGFYNRVAVKIVDRQNKEAWGLFSPGAVFFRRIAFASLLLLAGLGSFLVTREDIEGGADAATIIAQHDVAQHDVAQHDVAQHDVAPQNDASASEAGSQDSDRDRILVTLASYNRE